jgi:hypothetical protein
MSDEKPMGQVIQIDEARIRDHLGEMVRGTVEETLNAMLDAEADQLCGAGTGKGYFVKGRSGNPAGRPKNSPEFAPHTDDPDGADRRTVGNLVTEARKFSGLAVDTLVELTKDSYSGSTRYNAAMALLDRGYGRPAQSLDLHLSADAITKRLSDMTDAELGPDQARLVWWS